MKKHSLHAFFPGLFGAFFRIQIGSSTALYWLAFQGILAL